MILFESSPQEFVAAMNSQDSTNVMEIQASIDRVNLTLFAYAKFLCASAMFLCISFLVGNRLECTSQGASHSYSYLSPKLAEIIQFHGIEAIEAINRRLLSP